MEYFGKSCPEASSETQAPVPEKPIKLSPD